MMDLEALKRLNYLDARETKIIHLLIALSALQALAAIAWGFYSVIF